jgi:hypothetical protein
MNRIEPDIYDESALLDRLTEGVRRQDRSTVFLVGSPITAPIGGTTDGVPGVDGVIEIIREEFLNATQCEELQQALAGANNRYQAAFSFLLGRRGQQAVNDVIKRAVWMARKRTDFSGANFAYSGSSRTADESCRALETDYDGWLLPPAVDSLGKLLSHYPERFGEAVLTTNFDPLIEVSIGRLGGHFFRTVLHGDGNLAQTAGNGCHVIHLHGYWYGADTLHTPRQLTQARPRLKASLSSLVREKTLVVCGYGGWDDTFTEALMGLVLDDSAFPEIVWCLRSRANILGTDLLSKLAPGSVLCADNSF